MGCITTMSVERHDDTGTNLPVDGCDGFSGPTALQTLEVGEVYRPPVKLTMSSELQTHQQLLAAGEGVARARRLTWFVV